MATTKNNIELMQRSTSNSPNQKEKLATRGTQGSQISDDQTLLRLGKKPVLKRSFGFMSILGLSCTVLITWEGILVTSVQSLENGGPAGVIWGFLVDWLGTTAAFVTISELASMAPTAGGQYHWVSLLAPERTRNFLSYVTAWTTVAGWQAITGSSCYLLGTLIQGMIALNNPDYVPQPYQSMLFFWAVLFIALFVNATTGKILANFEGFILIFHLAGFFCVLIPMVYLGPHADPKAVFSTVLNLGGWSSDGLSFLVGLPAAAFCLLGADSAVHMSEEIQGAATVVPQAIIYSLVINGVLAWSMVIALMFCAGNLDNAVAAAETVFYPFLEIFQQAVNSNAGATAMASVIVVVGVASAVGVFAATSRMVWSFARDRGLPFSTLLSKLHPRTLIPIGPLFFTTIINLLISLIILGSSVAFNDILSLSVVALYSSYLIVCVLALYRRLRGDIAPYDPDSRNIAPGHLSWGPWKVPEPLGTGINAFACLYLAWTLFWDFWPPVAAVVPSNMNFAVVMFGGTIIFSVFWYIVRARKTFTGPIQEVTLDDAI